MNYYAAHKNFAVIFGNETDRDTFCKGNVFKPITAQEFTDNAWFYVRDFTEDRPCD